MIDWGRSAFNCTAALDEANDHQLGKILSGPWALGLGGGGGGVLQLWTTFPSSETVWPGKKRGGGVNAALSDGLLRKRPGRTTSVASQPAYGPVSQPRALPLSCSSGNGNSGRCWTQSREICWQMRLILLRQKRSLLHCDARLEATLEFLGCFRESD